MEHLPHCRSVRCRGSIGESEVGKTQSLVDLPEHPLRKGIIYFRVAAGIVTKPIGEIAGARLVVKFDGLPRMLLGTGTIAEEKAGDAGYAVRDHGLGTIRPDRRFA